MEFPWGYLRRLGEAEEIAPVVAAAVEYLTDAGAERLISNLLEADSDR